MFAWFFWVEWKEIARSWKTVRYKDAPFGHRRG